VRAIPRARNAPCHSALKKLRRSKGVKNTLSALACR
jgi:hypothetical protein